MTSDLIAKVIIIATVLLALVVLIAALWIKLLKTDIAQLKEEKKFMAMSLGDACLRLQRLPSKRNLVGDTYIPLQVVIDALDHLRAFSHVSEYWVSDLIALTRNTVDTLIIRGSWMNKHYLLHIGENAYEVGAYLPADGVPASSIRGALPSSEARFEVHLSEGGFTIVTSEKEAIKKVEDHAKNLRLKVSFIPK